jgi:hypothetical protein
MIRMRYEWCDARRARAPGRLRIEEPARAIAISRGRIEVDATTPLSDQADWA